MASMTDKEVLKAKLDRIRELERALRPFADYYSPTLKAFPDQHVLTQGSPFARRQLTVADIKAAYKVLHQLATI